MCFLDAGTCCVKMSISHALGAIRNHSSAELKTVKFSISPFHLTGNQSPSITPRALERPSYTTDGNGYLVENEDLKALHQSRSFPVEAFYSSPDTLANKRRSVDWLFVLHARFKGLSVENLSALKFVYLLLKTDSCMPKVDGVLVIIRKKSYLSIREVQSSTCRLMTTLLVVIGLNQLHYAFSVLLLHI